MDVRTQPGPYAFPSLHYIDGNWVKEPLPAFCGMTLRDYFAIEALNGMIASPAVADRTAIDRDLWSRIAYSWADSMMKARQS